MNMSKSSAAEDRPVLLGEYMVKNRATVRAAAEHFSVSKSTVHKDLRTRLPALDPELYEAAAELLELNKRERHLRGGEATKRKYKKINNKSNDLTE